MDYRIDDLVRAFYARPDVGTREWSPETVRIFGKILIAAEEAGISAGKDHPLSGIAAFLPVAVERWIVRNF